MYDFFEILSDTQVHIYENGNIVLKTVENASVFIDERFGEGKAAAFLATKDPKKQSDYYLVRENAGKALVNKISNDLLRKLENKELTFTQIIDIETKLEKTINCVRAGQFKTSKYWISQVVGVDFTLLNEIKTSIDELIQIHYA
jgi:hypothetical protein